MSLLDVKGLSVSFNVGDGRIDVVQNLDLTIEAGMSLSIIGESGSGKSVIASAILRMLESNAIVGGDVLFKEESIYSMSQKRLLEVRGKGICLVPQNASQAWDPLIRVGRQMTEFLKKTGCDKEKSERIALETLSECGFEDPENIMMSYPHKLSGGMSQRAMIAMCLASNPSLMIADEPTKGLDGFAMRQVLNLMTVTKKDYTLVMITHDLAAAMCCDDIAVLYGGMIVESGKSKDVLENPLHPYTKGLVMAHPRNGMRPIPGGGERRPNGGCPFRNRCGLATSPCGDTIGFMDFSGRKVRCIHA